jgi:hypothetical protein
MAFIVTARIDHSSTKADFRMAAESHTRTHKTTERQLLPPGMPACSMSTSLNQDVQDVGRMGRMEPATGIFLPELHSVVGVEKSTAIMNILLPILPILVQTL